MTWFQKVLAGALTKATLDERTQISALDHARRCGDSIGVVHYRNARDRNRLAIRWIRSRMPAAPQPRTFAVTECVDLSLGALDVAP